MKKYLSLFLFASAAVFLSVSSCKKDDNDGDPPGPPIDTTTPPAEVTGIKYTSQGTLTLNAVHVFGSQSLAFTPAVYYTAAQDTVKITQIRYYLTNVTLENAAGQGVNLGNYHLVDVSDAASGKIVLPNVPAGVYKKLTFSIGVDQARNHTGARDGALDPSYGMFWSWNTGYVFFRIKGRYSWEEKSYSFDIGGDNNLVKASIDLTSLKLSGTSFNVDAKVDFGKLFSGPTAYNLKTMTNEIHTGTDAAIPVLTGNMNTMVSLSAATVVQ